jgi:rare lipoprotein A
MGFLSTRNNRSTGMDIRSMDRRIANRPVRVSANLFVLLIACLLAAGCRHRQARIAAPAPPPIEAQPYPENPSQFPGQPLSTQVGIASWYGAPYHNARGANGQVYNQNAMTAAHRTLPMGTVVRVTNLSNRRSVVVTITDRGPFVHDRILDLSRAAALKIGVWRTGTARVRIDVLRFPPSALTEGRWCVQIGVFRHHGSAKHLRDRLQRKYPSANVIEFRGVTGYWVRIRPYGESHRSAQQIAQLVQPAEGEAYIVRLN